MRLIEFLRSNADTQKQNSNFITDIKTNGGILMDFIMYYFYNQIDSRDVSDFFRLRKTLSNHEKESSVQQDSIESIQDGSKFQYLYFINEKINLNHILIAKHTQVRTLKNITELLHENDTSNLIIFLNNYIANNQNISQKFTVSNESLIEEFNDYLELREINPTVFISFYAYLIKYNNTNAIKLGNEYRKKIELTSSLSIFSSIDLKKDYFLDLIENIKKELFLNINNKHIQFHGIIDRDGYFFIDLKQTLIDSLKIIENKDSKSHNYSKDNLDLEKSISYFKLIFLKHYQFAKDGKNLKSILDIKLSELSKNKDYYLKKIENQKSELEAELDELIKYHEDYRIFLTKKGFNENEILMIFNLFSQNRYVETGIKYLSNIKQVDFFRLCYVFYFFDFYIEIKQHQFNSIKSFELIFSFNINNDFSFDSLEQMRKYYLNIDKKANKHYPFNGYKKIVQDLSQLLLISREKLKPLPE